MRFVLLLMSALIVGSCATTIDQSTPPENYQGPIAAQPVSSRAIIGFMSGAIRPE